MALPALDLALIATSRRTLGDHVARVTGVFEDVLLQENRKRRETEEERKLKDVEARKAKMQQEPPPPLGE